MQNIAVVKNNILALPKRYHGSGPQLNPALEVEMFNVVECISDTHRAIYGSWKKTVTNVNP